MARPSKSSLTYFPCDCNFFNDCKVIALTAECGAVGQLVYIHLLCAIYSEGYYLKWDRLMGYKLQRDIPGLSLDELQRVIGYAVEFGLFDAELWAAEGVLTSVGIQSRYFEAIKRRVGSDALPYLLITLPGAKPAAAPASEVPATEVSAAEVPAAAPASEVPAAAVPVKEVAPVAEDPQRRAMRGDGTAGRPAAGCIEEEDYAPF